MVGPFIKKGAQEITVHVPAEFIDEKHIDGRGSIQVLPVSMQGVGEMDRRKGLLKLIQVISEILLLLLDDVIIFGIFILEVDPSRLGAPHRAGIPGKLVNFKDVSAGQVLSAGFIRLKPGDIEPVLVPFYFLDQHIDPPVVAVHHQLTQPCPRGIVPHVTEKPVG